MNQVEVDITDMQCHVYRMAQRKWNISPYECTALFQRFDIFGFIRECYDSLHLANYESALRDVETILNNNGVNLCKDSRMD